MKRLNIDETTGLAVNGREGLRVIEQITQNTNPNLLIKTITMYAFLHQAIT